MSDRFAKLHLGGLILIIIVFLWATLPGHAHAQQLQVCVPIARPQPAPPLRANRFGPLDRQKGIA